MKTSFRKGLIPGMILLCTTAFGQTEEQFQQNQNTGAGPTSYIRLMLNMVTTNVDHGQNNGSVWDHKTNTRGLQAGTSVQLGITSRVSVLGEFFFLVKGGAVAGEPIVEKTTVRFHTLELPVLARVHLGQFYLNAGPSLAYNLSGKIKTEESSTRLSFDRTANGYKRWDAGVQVGAGYQFRIKQKQLVLDARYSHGLTNISRTDEMYNRYLNISLQVINPWKINPIGRK